ncbi:hypothetical protein [Ahrensia marina]|uniref:Uncharacterized protein n=1 Tax=Ahrensia marina TaxID=1514904 RepID=A0A0N0E6E1_9HYPH|nr:hypothetical protein [Ahrensia marina]KPA99927.1 hypothetical protein SU32_16490 [Ahrensia marina]
MIEDEDKIEKQIIAGYIDMRRLELRLSDRDLAHKSGVAITTMNRLRDPKDKSGFQRKTIRALLEALDGNLTDFETYRAQILDEAAGSEQAKFAPNTKDEPNALSGWYRADMARFCKDGIEKPFLVTRFVNFEKRQMFSDLVRLVGDDVPDAAKRVPESKEILKLVHGNMLSQSDDDALPFIDIGAADYAEAIKLSYAIGAQDYKAACPHCGSTAAFTCYNCKTAMCFDRSGDYDPVCVNCGMQHRRAEMFETNEYKR